MLTNEGPYAKRYTKVHKRVHVESCNIFAQVKTEFQKRRVEIREHYSIQKW